MKINTKSNIIIYPNNEDIKKFLNKKNLKYNISSTSKTISAHRVFVLKEHYDTELSEHFTILEKAPSYYYRYFIVDKNWKEQLEKYKKINVIAEIGNSKS